MFANIALLLTGVINIILGSVVLARNPLLTSSRYFAAMTYCVSCWCAGLIVFYVTNDIQTSVLSVRFFYIAALWMNTFLLLFTVFYVKHDRLRKVVPTAILLSSILSIYIAFDSNFFIESITLRESGADIDLRIVPYTLYVLIIVGYYLANIYIFTKSYVLSRNQERTKLGLMLLGFLVAGIFALYFNVYLPYRGTYQYVWFGPLFTAGFVGFVTYAILRFKLFDIRKVFARTLAYFGSILVLLLLYLVFTFLVLFNIAPGSKNLGLGLIIGISSFSFLAGMLFRPIRLTVNRLTNEIFYRDNYDTQQQIDLLANIAVTKFEVNSLVKGSIDIIVEAVKPSSGSFILLDATGKFYRDYSVAKPPTIKSVEAVEVLKRQKHQVFNVDQFEAERVREADNSEIKVNSYLKGNQMSTSVRLSTKDEVVGYMVIGPKLSGNIYTKQDKSLLSIAANEMAIAIQNARRFDEIQRFNETLKQEIEEATRELRKSNEKLKALDTAKDEFITMASHQLRTPLTSVKGYLSMVLEGDTGKITNKQRYLLTSAFTSSQRMVYLIGDLLNVSRLQTGKFVIETSLVDLVDMVASEISQLKETAKSKKLKVKFNKPKDFPAVMLDETKTRQVLMNFIDNAIYYTPQGGTIEVNLTANDKKIEFTVVDDGIGVPKSEARNLFTKFYRAKNARKARPDGTGLGLFMAKKVIIDQGGAVIFHSKEGKGSTFGFTFPMSKVKPSKHDLDAHGYHPIKAKK